MHKWHNCFDHLTDDRGVRVAPIVITSGPPVTVKGARMAQPGETLGCRVCGWSITIPDVRDACLGIGDGLGSAS